MIVYLCNLSDNSSVLYDIPFNSINLISNLFLLITYNYFMELSVLETESKACNASILPIKL